ncbi:MAG: hypothetical protein ACPG21_01170 [Crocinitomicaceae bacterium]
MFRKPFIPTYKDHGEGIWRLRIYLKDGTVMGFDLVGVDVDPTRRVLKKLNSKIAELSSNHL